jgi:hypothetical protein
MDSVKNDFDSVKKNLKKEYEIQETISKVGSGGEDRGKS